MLPRRDNIFYGARRALINEQFTAEQFIHLLLTLHR
jgi:hypothetical protein